MKAIIVKSINTVRKNFFSGKIDSLITVSLIAIFTLLGINIFHWLIYIAEWDVVIRNLSLYFFGSYPKNEIWRPLSWILFLIFLTFFTITRSNFKRGNKSLTLLWLFSLPFGLYLIIGGLMVFPIIQTSKWGGITLTLILTISSFLISLPLGIILAIGRQSKLIFAKKVCQIYIDVMRSIPLIAVLFFGQLLIPLFLPIDIEVNRVLRAILAFALFTSAYIAEDVRGGLQSVPYTQIEAALALGLNQKSILTLIVLPQALKVSLPALTNQAIGLLQNTSLMAILGLVELLGISRSLLANPLFIGKYLEVYVWIGFLYWLTCTAIALLSRHIEKSLDTHATSN